MEELLAQTIEAARQLRVIRRSDLKRIIVDSSVQEKNETFPTGGRLLEVARTKLVGAARKENSVLRQGYYKVGPHAGRRQGVLHRGKPKRLTASEWRWLERRQAVEPTIDKPEGGTSNATLLPQQPTGRCLERRTGGGRL